MKKTKITEPLLQLYSISFAPKKCDLTGKLDPNGNCFRFDPRNENLEFEVRQSLAKLNVQKFGPVELPDSRTVIIATYKNSPSALQIAALDRIVKGYMDIEKMNTQTMRSHNKQIVK